MANRSATLKEIKWREAGTAGAFTTVSASKIAEGMTGPTPSADSEAMAAGNTLPTGVRYAASIPIKEADKLGAFTEGFIAPAGTATPTGTPAAPWVSLGRLMPSGSTPYTPVTGMDAGLVRIYFRMGVEVTFDVMDAAKHPTAKAYHGIKCALALKRVDGTFKVFDGLTAEVLYNPEQGRERFQTVRIRLNGAAFDITTLSKGISSSYFAALNTLQKAGKYLEIHFIYDDDTEVRLPNAGFSATPLEPFGEQTLEGVTLDVEGFGLTEGSVITVTPSLA